MSGRNGFGQWIANRPMNTKILLIIAVLAITAIGVGILSLSRMSALNGKAADLYQRSEIGRSVSEAAAGSVEIAQNITGVATAAQSTSAGVNEAQRAAHELAQMSENLQRVVGQFRV
jgi:methyl-accepting chemotaxis protein